MVRRNRVGCWILMLIALVVLTAGDAPSQPVQPDTSRIGPRVGERVPGFSGTDQFGRPQNLESVVGLKGAMLVFFRSADW